MTLIDTAQHLCEKESTMIFNVLFGIFLFYVVPMVFLKFLSGFAEGFAGKPTGSGSLLDMAYVPVMNLVVTAIIIVVAMGAIVIKFPAYLFNELGKYVGRKLS